MDLRSGKVTKGKSNMSDKETSGDEVDQPHVKDRGDENVVTLHPGTEMSCIMQYLQKMNDELKMSNTKLKADLNAKLDMVKSELKTDNSKLKLDLNSKFDNINLKLDTINLDLNAKLDATNQKINAIEIYNLELNKKIENTEIQLKNKIGTEVEKMRDDVDQVIKINVDKIENKIIHIDQLHAIDLNVLNEKMNSETQDIRTQMGNLKSLSNIQYVYNRAPQFEGIVQFYGDNRIHPKMFIKNLRESLDMMPEVSNLKSFIRNSLKKDAEIWYAIIEDKYETFDEFAGLFLSNFWGENQQSKIRENLFSGKYKDNVGCSREKYILKKYNYIRHLEPRIPDVEIANYLARHFSDDIRDVILIQGMDTIEKMLQYLRRIDDGRVDGHATGRFDDYQYDNRTYGNDHQNRTNKERRQYYNKEDRTYGREYNGNNRNEQEKNNNYRRHEQGNYYYRKNYNGENKNQRRENNQVDEQHENNQDKQDKRNMKNTEWSRIEEITTAMVEPEPKNKNF